MIQFQYFLNMAFSKKIHLISNFNDYFFIRTIIICILLGSTYSSSKYSKYDTLK